MVLGFVVGCGCDDDDHSTGSGQADDDADDPSASSGLGDTGDDDTGDDDDTADDDTGDDDTGDDDDDDTQAGGCISGEFDLYFGMFHSHSIFSDGRGLPREAFEHARDAGDLDVFALTDHLEMLYIPLPPDKWEILQALADEYNVPGSYVALAGFEYSSAYDIPGFVSSGHNNVFFSEEMFPVIMLDYHVFYQRLLECPTCLGQFNHPGYSGQTNWDGFEYHADVDPQMTQIELSTWGVDGWPFLFDALDQGWHVSPTWNQDNHNKGWGTEDDHRTGLWLSELTREAVLDCLRDRRTFSTLDKNASIRLRTEEDCWMGSILPDVFSATLTIEAEDTDEGDGFATIEIWGPGYELIDEFDCGGATWCERQWEFIVDASGYVLARAVQEDGDLLVSAPIWLGE